MSSIYDLIELIRQRPGLYTGQSLTRLDSFIHGYRIAIFDFKLALDAETPPFGQFHDWVARRFGWNESTAGWCNIILAESGSEEVAFKQFFVLLDLFRERKPTVVDSVELRPEHQWTGAVGRYSAGVQLPPPLEAKIIYYSNDAGCYLWYKYPEPIGEQEIAYFSDVVDARAQVLQELGVQAELWKLPN